MSPDRRNSSKAFASASGSSGPKNTKFKPPRPARRSPPPEEQQPLDASQVDPSPTIPAKLLSRILHEHFEDERTRISKDANAAVGRYIEVFVKEALARAVEERKKDGSSGGGAMRDSFLEVEDLEKVAPKLLLDF
ncbi:hypothetical protein FGG08_004987 [Glutinoglossum americanum]|uniref:Centromere protein X n=1 Tax=Glutinoglossum americanum TaxID=1670608 RepID=A0A9P8L3D2_9PEZI|nr:hypothetical protein FGG08_004987 [Glutinoglossum americanum]